MFNYFDLGWQTATGVKLEATNRSDTPALIDNGILALLDIQQCTTQNSYFHCQVQHILLCDPLLLIWCSRDHVYT